MQFDAQAEKADVVPLPPAYSSVSRAKPFRDDPQVIRTRQRLLTITGVFLALCVYDVIGAIFHIGSPSGGYRSMHAMQIWGATVSILFYTFGYWVAHRYSVIGLRIFAWLGIIVLLTMGILFVVIVAGLITISHPDERTGATLSMVLYLVLVLIVSSVVLTIIVKSSFKLAKLIASSRTSTNSNV